jgi:hypothetical protein
MTISYHSGERIQATSTDFAGTPAISGGWKELGRTSNSSLPDVTGLADKRYLMFLNFQESNASRPVVSMRINGDTGSNYALRGSGNGLTDYTSTSLTSIQTVGGQPQGDTTTVPYFTVGYIANLAGKEKLLTCHNTLSYQLGAGSSEPLERRETVAKWANTSDAVDQLSILTTAGGSFNTNGELIVLGWDPADTHTTNFWEELASVSGTSVTSLSTGTFTAKKYLWVQAHFTGGGNAEIQVGNGTVDTGSNYAWRNNTNGGSDAALTSHSKLFSFSSNSATAGGAFLNCFIINNASNEKLAIAHTVEAESAGAGTAPNRGEKVGKWANTSNQINIIKMKDDNETQAYDTCLIKVWGSD